MFQRTNDDTDTIDDDGSILIYGVPESQTDGFYSDFKECILELTAPDYVITDIGVRNEIEQFVSRP